MKPFHGDPAVAPSLSPSNLCLAFAYRRCACQCNGLLRVISHGPPHHMLSGQPHKLKQKSYRCSLRKGKMLTAPPWTFRASFLYELQFLSLCVFPYQACSLSRVPKLGFSKHLQVHHVNDTPLSFLPLEFRTCAHPREMQPETHTQRHFPGVPTSLCLASAMYS